MAVDVEVYLYIIIGKTIPWAKSTIKLYKTSNCLTCIKYFMNGYVHQLASYPGLQILITLMIAWNYKEINACKKSDNFKLLLRIDEWE